MVTERNRARLRVAILGYGYWGPNQARTFVAELGAHNVIVADSLPSRREAAAAVLPGVIVRADVASVINDPDVDAVCICTPTVTHVDIARQALLRGKHVLVEKPLATTSRDGQALVELAEHVGRVLMVGHVFLYSPPVQQLQRVLSEGELGDLRFLYASRASLGPRAREDVNVVWDYLIHDVYIVQSLLGEPVEVAAQGGAYLRAGIEDVVFATLQFSSGALANLHASWYDPLKIRRMTLVGSKRMAVYDENWEDRKVVVYDRGYAPAKGRDRWGNEGLRLYDNGERPLPSIDAEPLIEECRDFVRAIGTGDAPRASGRSALAVIRTLEEVDRSMARRDGGMSAEPTAASVRVMDAVCSSERTPPFSEGSGKTESAS